jgi:nucleoside phosphorylase
MTEKPYVDIGFIIPLREEFESLAKIFPRLEQYVEGVQFSTKVSLGVDGLSAVAYLQDDMGKSASGRAADRLLAKYEVGIIVVLGIAGGLSSDVSIGDVCFSGTIIDVLENAKVTDDKKGQKVKYTPKFLPTDPRLSFALKYIKLGTDTRPNFEHWQLEYYYLARVDVPGQFIGKENMNEEIEIPDAHDGNIACGSVSKSELYKTDFYNIDRKILAIETESGGAFHSAMLAGVQAVTIRGVCDYSDTNKNRFERDTNGKGREIAARNAAAFVKLQLSNPQFLSYLQLAKRSRLGVQAPPPVSDGMESSLSEIKDTIHQHLTELSPEYKGKPKGYRLPLPRMKVSSSTAKVNPKAQDNDPISVLEAITTNRIIMTNVPRNYPDKSLPWIIAAELSLITIGGKQAMPVVIQGDRIRPPGDTIISQYSQPSF